MLQCQLSDKNATICLQSQEAVKKAGSHSRPSCEKGFSHKNHTVIACRLAITTMHFEVQILQYIHQTAQPDFATYQPPHHTPNGQQHSLVMDSTFGCCTSADLSEIHFGTFALCASILKYPLAFARGRTTKRNASKQACIAAPISVFI